MTAMQHNLIDLIDEEAIDLDDEAPIIFRNSPYYTNESLTEMLDLNLDSFKILSLNCQSLYAKYNELKIYVESIYNMKFSAICLQETLLHNNSDVTLLQLNGYNLIWKGRSASTHGGVAIYLKDTFSYKILPITSNSNIWDGLFIEIFINELHSNKSIIIGNIYRPPQRYIRKL
jgi:hypothetical protein